MFIVVYEAPFYLGVRNPGILHMPKTHSQSVNKRSASLCAEYWHTILNGRDGSRSLPSSFREKRSSKLVLSGHEAVGKTGSAGLVRKGR